MRLSPSEARVYEHIKRGVHPKEITDVKWRTVVHSLKVLTEAGVVTAIGKRGRKRRYEAVVREYTVNEQADLQRKTRENPLPVLEESSDPLIREAARIELCADKLFYLQHHKHEPRSVLAKKLGLRKIEVTILLEKLA